MAGIVESCNFCGTIKSDPIVRAAVREILHIPAPSAESNPEIMANDGTEAIISSRIGDAFIAGDKVD
ncbi:MAG: hypothetical protein AB7D42_04600 [Candidatus Methanomethylophilaceae archaeon]